LVRRGWEGREVDVRGGVFVHAGCGHGRGGRREWAIEVGRRGAFDDFIEPGFAGHVGG